VPDIVSLEMNTASLTDRLYTGINNIISAEKRRLSMILEARSFNDPAKFFSSEYENIEKYSLRLKASAEKILYKEKTAFAKTFSALESLNPLSVLLRGYSLVSLDGEIVESVEKLSKDDRLQVFMSDGTVDCQVLSTERKGKK
jgi:exodeoxyribonuclease VII large subunit